MGKRNPEGETEGQSVMEKKGIFEDDWYSLVSAIYSKGNGSKPETRIVGKVYEVGDTRVAEGGRSAATVRQNRRDAIGSFIRFLLIILAAAIFFGSLYLTVYGRWGEFNEVARPIMDGIFAFFSGLLGRT